MAKTLFILNESQKGDGELVQGVQRGTKALAF